MSEDIRCFMDCNSVIKFVKDLPASSYQIDASFQRCDAITIDILEEDCDEKLVSDTYVLHDSIEALNKELESE